MVTEGSCGKRAEWPAQPCHVASICPSKRRLPALAGWGTASWISRPSAPEAAPQRRKLCYKWSINYRNHNSGVNTLPEHCNSWSFQLLTFLFLSFFFSFFQSISFFHLLFMKRNDAVVMKWPSSNNDPTSLWLKSYHTTRTIPHYLSSTDMRWLFL